MGEMIGTLIGGLVAGWIWVAIAKAVIGIDRHHKRREVLMLALCIVGGCAVLASAMGSQEVMVLIVVQSAGVVLAWRSFSREAQTQLETEEEEASQESPGFEDAESNDNESAVVCWSCEAANRRDARSCTSCGASLRAWRCGACRTRNAREAASCDGCGKKRGVRPAQLAAVGTIDALSILSEARRRQLPPPRGRDGATLEACAARIAHLFPEAWDGTHADELRDAMENLPDDAIPILDRILRGRSWKFLNAMATGDLLLAASCHPSGHVREAAVRKLAARADGRELPFLIVRLNDWVREVRDAAEVATRPRLRTDLRDAWISSLPLVLALGEQRRADHAWLVQSVQDLVVGDDGSGAWRAVEQEARDRVRRALLTVASQHPRSVIDPESRLAEDRDPVVATKAALAVIRGARGSTAALMPLWRARHPRVRRVALEALLSSMTEIDTLLREAAFDADATVRELARFELGKRAADVRALYRNAVRSPEDRDPVAALHALADVAEKADAAAFQSLLSDPRPRLRAFAVSVLARWDGSSLFAMLDDPSRRVVRAAVAALLPDARVLDHEALWTKIATAPTPTALAALRLGMGAGVWRAFDFAVRAAALDRAEVAEEARVQLSRLFSGPIFATPTPGEVEDLRATLAAARGRVDARTIAAVQDSLRRLEPRSHPP